MILLLIAVCFISFEIKAQGTYKICPNSGQWKPNPNLYGDENFMFNDYAKGPDGCWWLKFANFASYTKGRYIFRNGNSYQYFYYLGNKVWSNGNACVPNPFNGKWEK